MAERGRYHMSSRGPELPRPESLTPSKHLKVTPQISNCQRRAARSRRGRRRRKATNKPVSFRCASMYYQYYEQYQYYQWYQQYL